MPTEYLYCKICRISHVQGAGHKFSKSHIRTRNERLEKFHSKMKLAQQQVDMARIEDKRWEFDQKFWCIFCCQEILKHIHTLHATVPWGTFLEHVASLTHKENLLKFLKDEQLKEARSFSIDEECLMRFKITAEERIQDLEYKNAERISEISQSIAQVEDQREEITQKQNYLSNFRSIPAKSGALSLAGSSSTCSSSSGLFTISAHADGLTCLDLKAFSRKKDNVHSGVVPPWLTKATSRDQGQEAEIGPSLEDYKQFLHEEKLKKLPVSRVGATQPREVPCDSKLPTFGGVWSKSRRNHAKKAGLKFTKTFSRDDKPSSAQPVLLSGCDVSQNKSRFQQLDSSTATKHATADTTAPSTTVPQAKRIRVAQNLL